MEISKIKKAQYIKLRLIFLYEIKSVFLFGCDKYATSQPISDIYDKNKTLKP